MPDENPGSVRDGGIAVGAYLRFLRESKGISVVEVAQLLKTDQSQIWRIEKWRSDVRSTLLFGYIKAVKGNAEDVARLLNNPRATKEDGEALARLRLGLQD